MDPVYLDHAATTPVRAEVHDAMAPLADEVFGNPSSRHSWGRAASAALEDARAEAAAALRVRNAEIYFVRGGTEGDNLAVCGACRALQDQGHAPRLLVSAIEHHAVLHVAERMQEDGEAELDVFDVSQHGEVDFDVIGTALDQGPAVVSCMWVNNETGVRSFTRMRSRPSASSKWTCPSTKGSAYSQFQDTRSTVPKVRVCFSCGAVLH
jgi:cysteine desulfurase